MDHLLYRYSAVPLRSTPQGPGAPGLQAYVVLCLEHWDAVPAGDAVRDPRFVGEFGTFTPDYRSWTQREYGLRIGVFRVLDALREAGLRPAIAANARAVERLPRLVAQLAAWGCEWIGHGVSANALMHSRTPLDLQRSHISHSLEAIESCTGRRPVGWLSQDWGTSADTFDLLGEAGVRYTLDWCNDDQAYALSARSQPAGTPLVALPLSAEWDDVQCQWLRQLTPQAHADLAVQAFDGLRAECARDRRSAVFGLALHPWVCGMSSRIAALRRLLRSLRSRPDACSGPIPAHSFLRLLSEEPILDYQSTFSRFAATLSFDELPASARAHTGWILADSVAAIVAGSAEPELRAWAALQPEGGGATLVGLGREAQPAIAALINGTAGTFLEMDEGNRFSRGHPAMHVLPALLALAEQVGGDARTFLAALVAGYEVGSRIGAASQLRGAMHPHGTWGTVGAAAACARLLGRDADGMRETLNVSASMTIATSKRTMLEGGLVRNVYAGLGNMNGYLAAQLAGCGFTGERDGLGSLFGEIVSEHFDTGALLQDLGQDWHLTHNYFKLHSCCRYNHGTLDAIDSIDARDGLPRADEIERVEVRSYRLAAELDDPEPRNTLAAKFSVPFAVATRLVNGNSRLASFTWDSVRDPRVRALARKVTVTEDPAMTLRLPHERPAHVVISDRSGRRWVGEAGVNRGDDAAPYSDAELGDKFRELAARVWPADHAEAVLQSTHALCAGTVALPEWLVLLRRPPLR